MLKTILWGRSPSRNLILGGKGGVGDFQSVPICCDRISFRGTGSWKVQFREEGEFKTSSTPPTSLVFKQNSL